VIRFSHHHHHRPLLQSVRFRDEGLLPLPPCAGAGGCRTGAQPGRPDAVGRVRPGTRP